MVFLALLCIGGLTSLSCLAVIIAMFHGAREGEEILGVGFIPIIGKDGKK